MKVFVSTDGRFNNATWETSEIEFNPAANPHLKCTTEKGEFMQITFRNEEEFNLFHKGAALCRAYANNVNRGYNVFLTLPQIPKAYRGEFSKSKS